MFFPLAFVKSYHILNILQLLSKMGAQYVNHDQPENHKGSAGRLHSIKKKQKNLYASLSSDYDNDHKCIQLYWAITVHVVMQDKQTHIKYTQ